MMDDTAIRFRRYMVYALIIFLWAIFLVFTTAFFEAAHKAKTFLQVP